MAYWYACDVIKVEPPASGSNLDDNIVRYVPMIQIDTAETWKITHLQSGTVRDVTFGGLRSFANVNYGIAYERDNVEPEMCLIRTVNAIPQALLDEVNATGGGGQFIVHINTVAKRNALYADYPSLQNRFPDQT